MRAAAAIPFTLLLVACSDSHPPAADGGMGGGRGIDVGERSHDTGASVVPCPGEWPELSFATVRLDCAPDGGEAIRIYVTAEPHGCDAALDGTFLDLLGFERPEHGGFAAWYEDRRTDVGDALFCQRGACAPIDASRWYLDVYRPGETSPGGFNIACATETGETLTAGAGFEAAWCGPTMLACR